MRISDVGINLITQFEGLRLKAYKAIKEEKYYTIGYGHYGSDVKKDMTITKDIALKYLKTDLTKFENYVNSVGLIFTPTQNQFDALVSFTYNCGQGSLERLTKNRTAAQISEHMLSYVYANGKKLDGLVKRRIAERNLFNKKDSGVLSLTQYNELKNLINSKQNKVKTYNTIKDIPDWCKTEVEWAIENGIIQGDGNSLALDETTIKNVIMLYRFYNKILKEGSKDEK